MDSGNNPAKDCIILSNDFPPLQEDEVIKIEKYYDISSKRFLSFIKRYNGLYVVMNKKMFGSAFLGNCMLPQPKYLIVKKIDPLLILLNLLYSCSSLTNHVYITLETLMIAYKVKINEKGIADSSFIQRLLEENKQRLPLICLVRNEEGEEYQYCESKMMSYLNTKINLTKKEEDSIKEENPNVSESDLGEMKKRKLKEKCEIMSQFLPEELFKRYTQSKGIELNPKVTPEPETLKRKNNSNNEHSANKTIKQKKTAKKEQKTVEKGQSTLNFFLQKK